MALILGTNGDDNPLNGTPGDDTIDGLAGADFMVGGTGNDTYYVDNSGDQVIEAVGQGTDTVYTKVDYTLADGEEVEYLRGRGSRGLVLTGNEFDNYLVGTTGDDTLVGRGADDRLKGGVGADQMTGGAGNDSYYVDNAGDQVTEVAGEGIDTIYSSVDYTLAAGNDIEYLRAFRTTAVSLTGNELDNHLNGSSGSDTLNGGGGHDRLNGSGGADVMAGGDGNDDYYVDDFGDQVIEAAGEGFDTIYAKVSYALAAGQEIEVLRVYQSAVGLALTGNELDNSLVGGGGDDTLDGGGGNDRLSGRDGDDSIGTTGLSAIIHGGAGNDSIRLDGTATSTGLADGGEGNDTIYSSDLGQFVIRNVETLDTYYGFVNGSVAQFASFDAYRAVFGALDVQISFSLRGAGGTLDFTTGISGQNSVEIRDAGLTSAINVTGSVNGDRMFGTEFNDTFKGGAGQDALFGGDGTDVLKGGADNDLLNGGMGNDKLTGGGGADTFAFDTPFSDGLNIDVIADFSSGVDTIQVDATYYFTGLAVGRLAAAQFSSTGTATSAGPQIVYDQGSGALFYDGDGTGAGAAVQFAKLTGNPTLTNNDINVVIPPP